MAVASNFSRIMLNSAKKCCKILQHPQFRNFDALLHGKRCFSSEVRDHPTYLPSENTKRHLQLLQAEMENLHTTLKTIDNLTEELSKEGDVMFYRMTGVCSYGNGPDRYSTKEMAKVSTAEVRKLMNTGRKIGKLLDKLFPFLVTENNPRRWPNDSEYYSDSQDIMEQMKANILRNPSPVSELDQDSILEETDRDK